MLHLLKSDVNLLLMLVTYKKRMRDLGCELKNKLALQFSHNTGSHFEPQRNRKACHCMMMFIRRRVDSNQMAALRDEVAKEAEELCALGQCAAALVLMQRAIEFGDLSSRALIAWLLITGRKGIAKNRKAAFDLAEVGARAGCHHCQGVLAFCYKQGYGIQDYVRTLELARKSSDKGSRYGQLVIGQLYQGSTGVLAQDYAQSLVFYQKAAAQGLDIALCEMACAHFYGFGFGVSQDNASALRLYMLAATQGFPDALRLVADFYKHGCSVPIDMNQSAYWEECAKAADEPGKEHNLWTLATYV